MEIKIKLRKAWAKAISLGNYPPPPEYAMLKLLMTGEDRLEDLNAFLKKFPDASRWARNGDPQPLAYALRMNYLKLAKTLIAHDPALLNDRIERGTTPFEISMTIDVPGLPKKKINPGKTALQFSLQRRKHLEFLVQEGADIRRRDSDGNTLLQQAIESDKTPDDVFAFLVGQGVDVNAVNKNGETAAMQVVIRAPHHLDHLKTWISADLSVRAKNEKTLLMLAEDVQSIRFLILRGADTEAVDASGKTAFWQRLTAGDYKLANELARNGAVIDPDHPAVLKMLEEDIAKIAGQATVFTQDIFDDYEALCKTVQDRREQIEALALVRECERAEAEKQRLKDKLKFVDQGIDKPLRLKILSKIRIKSPFS